MPNWYYDKSDLKQTPSNLDNLDYETEQRYRREGARFIINVGTTMGLRYDTMATGVVYFHRFYMFHSFRTFPRYVTACCCLFLAGKVEETPKKCKDIIKTARTLLTDKYFAQFGEDPKVCYHVEEVMTLERILLQTIKFDLQVDHPYSYLLKYAKALKGDKTKVQKLVQMAWTFVNDSLCTTLCLQWEPEIIAIALMYLASKLSKFEVLDWSGRSSKHNRWWDMFVEDMTVELLEDICHQVLDLYSTPISNTPKDSPPPSPPPQAPSIKSRPSTPLPTAKSSSPVKGESAVAAAAAAVPVTQAITAIPVAGSVVAAAPLPPAPVVARTPVATPAVIVGHPIPCLEEGVVKPPLPAPPTAKSLILPLEPHGKVSAQPPLVSPIQSLASAKFNYPQSVPKPPTTPKAPPPQLPPKEEPYSYVPPPPLPPPPGPPFQQTVFRDSPKEPYGPNPGGYRSGSQYYAGSEPGPNQYYNAQDDKKPFYPAGGAGTYLPGHQNRPYPDVYSSAPPPPSAAVHPPLVHPPANHPPPVHVPPGHIPTAHPPASHIAQGHPPQGHAPPGHAPGHGHVPPLRGLPGHPVGPYDDKPRPYLPGSAFPTGPRQPQNPAEGQYHFSHEATTPTHATATGIPTVRITGRY